jgi:hypothetical protein
MCASHNIHRSPLRHFTLLSSPLPFGIIVFFKVTLLDTLLHSKRKISGPTSTTFTSSAHLLPADRMGGQADKPKRVTVTETSGFKEEDRLWSIINIHLSCAINMVLSLCAVIFVLCLLAFIIHRIVRRYCKKKDVRQKNGNTGFRCYPSFYHPSLLVSKTNSPLPTVTVSPSTTRTASPTTRSRRRAEQPCTNSYRDWHLLHHLPPPPLPAVLPPALPGQLNHPISA